MTATKEQTSRNEMLVELQQITRTFKTNRGELKACNNVTLSIRRGTSLGLVGESGSGKSTLIRIMQLLLPTTAGQIYFDGAKVGGFSERKLKSFRRQVTFVAQDPYGSLFPNLTVAQNIMEPLHIHGVGNRASREERVTELLERVGLSLAHYHAYPHELSGGQQQRVAIARALALEPSMIVLDEAVSSLDVSIQAQILNLLQSLKDELGLTYVFISHNLAVVRLLCEETAVMYLGQIVERSNSEKLFQKSLHPYTQSLIAAIPAFSAEGVTPLPSASLLRGEAPSPTRLPSGCSYHTRCPFATERCRAERPELREVERGHFAACHYAEALNKE